MSKKLRQAATLLVTVALLTTAAGGALAAGLDSETTNTASTSDTVGGDNIDATYNGSSDADTARMTITVSSTDPGVRLIDPETDETLKLYKNASMTQTYAGTSTWYYNLTVNTSVLNNLEIDSGETKNVTVQIVDNVTLDDVNETVTNKTVKVTGVEGRSVRFIGSNVGTDDLTNAQNGLINTEVAGYSLQWGVDNYTSISQSSVAVSPNVSDEVTLHFANNTAVSNFDTAAEAYDSGDWMFFAPASLSGDYIKVYKSSAPDSVDANSTYGVYKPGPNDLKIHVGEDYASNSSVDVSATGNDALGIWNAFQAYGAEGLQKAASTAVGL